MPSPSSSPSYSSSSYLDSLSARSTPVPLTDGETTSNLDTNTNAEIETDSDLDSDNPLPPSIYIMFPLGRNPSFLQPTASTTPDAAVDLFIRTIHEYTSIPRRRAKVSIHSPPPPPMDRKAFYLTLRVIGWYDPLADMEEILQEALEEAGRLAERVRRGELRFEDFLGVGVVGKPQQ